MREVFTSAPVGEGFLADVTPGAVHDEVRGSAVLVLGIMCVKCKKEEDKHVLR